MDSTIAHDLSPYFLVHKDGHIERLISALYVPPSDDSFASVRSKDIVISPEVSARVYLPISISTGRKKRPVLMYFHGGAFCLGSVFSARYHPYLNRLVATADVVAVSVEYRLAPEHPIAALYDDSWTALKWVALHGTGQGPEPWLNEHADLGRIFFLGDSSGGNIANDLAIQAGLNGLEPGSILSGMVLVHPYFGDNNGFDKLWEYLCKDMGQIDPRLISPPGPDMLKQIGCGKVLVCLAERDFVRESGWGYYKALEKSEWGGILEFEETEAEVHVFHLTRPDSDKSRALMSRIVSFINQI